MVSLEQVKMLEAKVVKAIEHVNRITDENNELKKNLDASNKRIEELELLIRGYGEGILSSLDILNQFEDSIGFTEGQGEFSAIPEGDGEQAAETNPDSAQSQQPNKDSCEQGQQQNQNAGAPGQQP
ncbi:hypothetical protein ACYULU_09655 [Breznakiellaceae bacterium SP9]